MNTPKSTAATILIATDIVGDAALVKNMLNEEFDHVFTSTDPAQAVADFEQHRPDVLVWPSTSWKNRSVTIWGYTVCVQIYISIPTTA